VRDLVGTAAARLAQDHAAEVLMALASPDSGRNSRWCDWPGG